MSRDVGVAIVGHGRSASVLLDAARGILGDAALVGVVAIDAGDGETAEHSLEPEVCAAIERADVGAGVLVLVDLVGASPCRCAQRDAVEHGVVVLGGLNLAMLLKLGAVNRGSMSPAQLATACADSARRAVAVRQAGGEQPSSACGGGATDKEVAS